MIPIALYLTLLFIAPQIWIPGVQGIRVDLYLYPVWLFYVVLTGRLLDLFRFRTQDWLFLASIAWSAFSVIVNGMSPKGVDILFFLAKWFLLYRLTVASVGGAKGVWRVTKLLVFFALILSVEGIQHYWSRDGIGWAGQSLGWVDEAASSVGIDRRTRWINIFDGPGVFCIVFTIALPFVLQFFGPPFRWFVRALALVPMTLLILAIYYTGSRGGWLTTLLLIGAWVAARRGLAFWKVAAVGTVGLFLALMGPAYLTSTRDSSKSAQHRVDAWAEGIDMVTYNPVFGIGRGNFAQHTGRLIAHNSAIEMMGESGIPGLFLWVAMSFMAFKTLRQAMVETDDELEVTRTRALMLSLGGYLVSAMFVTLEYETFYFLLALARGVGEGLEAPPRFEARDAKIILAVMLAFFVLLKAFVMVYYR